MDAKRTRDERMLAAAKELATTHGVFFAATLLEENGVPLDEALSALTGTKRLTCLLQAAELASDRGKDLRCDIDLRSNSRS